MERVVEVAPDRVAGWVERFERHHPGATQQVLPDGSTRVEAPDGAYAVVPAAPPSGLRAVLLVRRSAYAVAMADTEIRAKKVGTRHIQGRSAAGGWSQQRFARRRENATSALVEDVAGHLVALAGEGSGVAALVTGGDRQMVTDVLTDRRLRHLLDLPRLEYFDIPDPTKAVLADVLARAGARRVLVHDPGRER